MSWAGSDGSLLESIASPADLRRLSLDELRRLADEIRAFIVATVAEHGGHLSPNLGVVELTLALHRQFESPRDVLLWDTGHQAYVHKLVTGRRRQFATLRKAGGLSGFPSRRESTHDWIENSHASTSLSYAYGVAAAVEASGDERRVVAVIGDGALTGGMAFEGLNNLGLSGRRVVDVLNDNGRSYAPTISRLSLRLDELGLSRAYVDGTARLEAARASADGSLTRGAAPADFFRALGFAYLGAVDGHDLEAVEAALGEAKAYRGPVVVHVLTEKGRGYRFAREDDEKRLHDVTPFDPTKRPGGEGGSGDTYTKVFVHALLEAAAEDDRIHAITAAMPGPTGLLAFEARYPERFHDVGIAEQHAVASAAGMAMAGLRPVVAIFSTFFCRAVDQLVNDVGLHRAPVVFCIDRAGITGSDGPSHHGSLDLALATKIPGLTVFAPSSALELRTMLREALSIESGPSLIRFPKGRAADTAVAGSGLAARRIRTGDDGCIVAVGRLVGAAERAADLLAADGYSISVWDARVAAPLDELMLRAVAAHPLVATVEDGVYVGGVGSAVVERMASLRPSRRVPAVIQLGTPLRYLPQGNPDAILSDLGLDAEGIARVVGDALRARDDDLPRAGSAERRNLVGA